MQIKFVWKKGIFLHIASLSKELLQGLLRGKLGFNGMITTDVTNMVGFGCAGRRKELLPKSINAGCDMLLFTKNLKEDYETVLEAVKSGIISEERLNEAVTYILATKASLKLHEKQKSHTLIPDESALDILRCKKHIDMAYQVTDKAITLVKDEQNLLPLSKDKYKKVLTIVLGDAISASGKPTVGDHQSDIMHLEEHQKEILLLVQKSNRKKRRNSKINGCYYLKKYCIFSKK